MSETEIKNHIIPNDILIQYISQNNIDFLYRAVLNMTQAPEFRYNLKFLSIDGEPEIDAVLNDDEIILTIPIKYNHRHQDLDAECTIIIDNDEIDPSVQVNFTCANQIFHQYPSEKIRNDFYSGKLSTIEPYKIVNSKFLHNSFFAISSDYSIFAKFSPNSEHYLTTGECSVNYSAKSFKKIPFYSRDFHLSHLGGTQVYNCDRYYSPQLELTEKVISNDIFFNSSREYQQFNFVQIKASNTCIVKRTEQAWDNKTRIVPLKTVSKLFNENIIKQTKLSKLNQDFNLRCSLQDKSQLTKNQQSNKNTPMVHYKNEKKHRDIQHVKYLIYEIDSDDIEATKSSVLM